MIVATSEPFEAYGEVIELGDQVLEELAAGLRTGAMNSLWQHDIRRPAAFQILDAGVRERADGEREVWALADVDADEWAEYQAGLKAAGAPGGMSFSGSEPLGELSSLTPDGAVSLKLSADRGHWTDDEILEAAEELRPLGSVSVGRRFEFAHDPRAVVDLWLAWKNVGEPLVLGVAGNVLYAALRRFLRRDKPTIFHVTVEEGSRGSTDTSRRKTTASSSVRSMHCQNWRPEMRAAGQPHGQSPRAFGWTPVHRLTKLNSSTSANALGRGWCTSALFRGLSEPDQLSPLTGRSGRKWERVSAKTLPGLYVQVCDHRVVRVREYPSVGCGGHGVVALTELCGMAMDKLLCHRRGGHL